MADRTIENDSTDVPEIPEELERVLVFALDEGKEKLEGGEDLVPFTALIVKDNLFLETHPGENAEECFAAAEANVRGARGAGGYAFCYDGYIETDDGVKDAIIAEGGQPGAEAGYAVAYLYTMDDNGAFTFEAEPAYIGEAPNFMEALKEPLSYAADEIDEKYAAAGDDGEDAGDECCGAHDHAAGESCGCGCAAEE